MRANHRPAADRLESRIVNLRAKIKYGDYWTKKKFYPKCIGCGLTNVEVSIRDGHRPGCWVAGVLKEIEHYERLLTIAKE